MIWLLTLLATMIGPALVVGGGDPAARGPSGGVTIPLPPPEEVLDAALPAGPRRSW